MKIYKKKLKDVAYTIGVILGYVAILTGVIMTFLILRTIFNGV